MKKFKILLLALTAISSVNVAAAEQGWTGPHLVKLVDSATASKNHSLVTLEGYSNGICSSDRIFLSIEDDQKFNQLFSMLLGAFHSGKKVDFYLPNSSDCTSTRLAVLK